jgi:hypothetical protein
MKTRLSGGFSPNPHSLNFTYLHADSCRQRQNQGRKFDGASGVRSLRTRRIAPALLAPSIPTYRRPFAFSSERRRRADGSVLFSASGARRTTKAGLSGRVVRACEL